MNKDQLGNRCKKYESAFNTHLPERMPIILRLDGNRFSKYTKECKRPVDDNLVSLMNDTAIHLCEKIQGAKLAFIQSDEISILLINYENINSQCWFDNNVNKMCSIASGMASAYFTVNSDRIFNKHKLAAFDCRAFVVPKEDVCNVLLWRQQDIIRNSVQMLSRTLYSHKQLDGKNISELKEMCLQKGFNWNDCPNSQKFGRCIVKTKNIKEGINHKTGEKFSVERSEWIVDNNIPIFSNNRNYIEKYL